MPRIVQIGWLLVLADAAYWIVTIATGNEEAHLPGWHAWLNLVLYVGGGALFLLLLVWSLLVHARRRELLP